ncbi:hypothetical protein [Tamlana sp. I1]|uniref:hypothetical protein n=1 Tax=Tamlana sp. I1 TaxID=2762061 RepID=UPI00188FF8F3|nr:hypothetical protein [Tamlana sp. I1]
MNIENTADFLKQFDYKFKRKGDTITIIMDYSHRIFIDFKNPNKIVIKDQLVTWNFITGMLKMSIRKAILLNLLCNMGFSALIAFFDLSAGIAVFCVLLIWTLFWSIVHISKYDKLRDMLTNWSHQGVYSIES